MSGSTAWTASPIYDMFSQRLELFDVYFLRSTILKRIMNRKAQIDEFSVDAVDTEFDQFWKDCEGWFFDTTIRADRYKNVHFALQSYITAAIRATGQSYRESIKCLRLPFFESADLMFGIHQQEIEATAVDGWLFNSVATKNDSMNCMHYWLGMSPNVKSPFERKASGRWFQYLRAHASSGVPPSDGIVFHTNLLRTGGYLWAMMRLAQELEAKCVSDGVRVEVNGDLKRLYEDVCYPITGTERENFKNQGEDFQPSQISGEEVQLDYLDVNVTNKRFERSELFRPRYMELTPPLMAFLKLLVMENYGEFDWDVNTKETDKFPEDFYLSIQAGTQEIDGRRLITFKGRKLPDAQFVVTPEFMRLWESPRGLTADVTEDTKHYLLEKRNEQTGKAAVEIRKETSPVPAGDTGGATPSGGATPFVRGVTRLVKKPDDNTTTYVVVGACLVAAIFFLNR